MLIYDYKVLNKIKIFRYPTDQIMENIILLNNPKEINKTAYLLGTITKDIKIDLFRIHEILIHFQSEATVCCRIRKKHLFD